ncbi:Hypothetical protein ABZS17G119_00138 [Kosakonia cowanii]
MVYLLIYDPDLILKKIKLALHKKQESTSQQLLRLFCEPAHVCVFSQWQCEIT